jgi:integrase
VDYLVASADFAAASTTVKLRSASSAVALSAGPSPLVTAWWNVLAVVYLIFIQGYGGRIDLAAEAIRLARADGRCLDPDVVSQTFDRLVRKLDMSVISLHGLRHTHATILRKAGVPTKVVSERLGHAKTSITEELYQH